MASKKRVGKQVGKTGGDFNPRSGPIYFIAGNVEDLTLGSPFNDHLLIAVNELHNEEKVARVARFMDDGKKVFVDSGVYNLAMGHARKHNMTMDAALSIAPDDIDGFAELYARYTSILHRLGDRSWGYIEIDQGGRDNKIKTRARLEKEGLRPVPVYHPLNDGWDYFDELAQKYDRICFGNLVAADTRTRLKLCSTMWDRHRKYPDLWIHLLGVTPSEMLAAYPSNSADSSSWLSSVRWASPQEYTQGRALGHLTSDFMYQLGVKSQYTKSKGMSAYIAQVMTRNWRNAQNAMTQEGIEVYA